MAHPLGRLVPLFDQRRGLLLASSLGLLVGTGLSLLGPWLVSRAIDVDLAGGDRAGLDRTAGLYLVVLVANLGVTYASRVGIEIIAQLAMVRLKVKLFDHLVDHDLAFHDRQPSGKLITRVQGDTEALKLLFSEVILTLPADLALLVGMLGVIGVTAPEILPPVVVLLVPYAVVLALYGRMATPVFLAVRKVKAALTGFLAEHVRAMPTLRQFDRVGWANARLEALNADVFGKEVVSGLVSAGYFNALFLVRSLGMVGLLWWGALEVAAGTLTVGALVMGLGYLRLMFNPLMRLSHNLDALERARSAAIRIGEILDTPRKITSPAHPAPWPGLRDAVRLEDVRFHYADGAPVLRGVSLEIPAGRRIGIVGATGAGKSTVLNLLLRFRDPVAGAVTVDGVDLRRLELDDVRRRIGLVLQDVHLFPGTVLENLGGDREAAGRALRVLGIDQDLDRVVREGGADLSRGERQLLTFARALVRDPELLVLDEATSAVDPATEARLQRALEQLLEGRTTVIVAHRLATVRDCDRIYVLGDGLVREVGTHAELLARGGVYAALTQLQEGVAA